MYTTVQLFSNASGKNRLIFGVPAFIIHGAQSTNNYKVGFNPNSILCLFHSELSNYGTHNLYLLILNTLNSFESGNIIKFVNPGAEILLQAKGRKHVNKVLYWLNTLNISNTSIPEASFFKAASNRFKTNLPPRDPEKISPLWRLL
jgi:hypothetical protein